jgi:hypothetical protein
MMEQAKINKPRPITQIRVNNQSEMFVFPVYLFIVFLIGAIFYTLFFVAPKWWIVYLVALGISSLCGQIFGLGLYIASEKSNFEMKRIIFKRCIKNGWYFTAVCFLFLVLQINFDLI